MACKGTGRIWERVGSFWDFPQTLIARYSVPFRVEQLHDGQSPKKWRVDKAMCVYTYTYNDY